jgi:hypothetical protein
LSREVLVEVVHGFPPLGQDYALGVKGVSGDYVFEAALFLSR